MRTGARPAASALRWVPAVVLLMACVWAVGALYFDFPVRVLRVPAAVLLAAFIGTGSSFLAFAVMASQAGVADTAALRKSFHYLGGLTEATETLAAFVAMCWWPQHFAAIAYGFAALCGLTIAVRIHAGYVSFKPQKDTP